MYPCEFSLSADSNNAEKKLSCTQSKNKSKRKKIQPLELKKAKKKGSKFRCSRHNVSTLCALVAKVKSSTSKLLSRVDKVNGDGPSLAFVDSISHSDFNRFAYSISPMCHADKYSAHSQQLVTVARSNCTKHDKHALTCIYYGPHSTASHVTGQIVSEQIAQ